MRRTWSSSSYNKKSSMGRRLRWNQTENSLKLSLALAYGYVNGPAPAVFDSNAWRIPGTAQSSVSSDA